MMTRTCLIILFLWVSAVAVFAQNSNPKRVPQTSVSVEVNASLEKAFDYVIEIDLSRIFKAYKNNPAVVATSVKKGWNTAGLVRTVYLADGTTLQETLTNVARPETFSYKVSNFTASNLRRSVKRIEGTWLFTDIGNRRTKIEWTYKVYPTNFITKFFVRRRVKREVKVVMSRAIDVIKEDLNRSENLTAP